MLSFSVGALVCVATVRAVRYVVFFFNDTATTEIYTLSLHDALPISYNRTPIKRQLKWEPEVVFNTDRKSTRLNSSHQIISYAVFCLKKKKHSRDLKPLGPARPKFIATIPHKVWS